MFFVYGTLKNEPALRACGTYLGPARVRGTLHDVGGAFPALVAGDGVVHGVLWEPRPAERRWAYRTLDRREGEGRIYLRRPVQLLDGGVAEAYVWNQPVDDLPVIQDGVWRGGRRVRARKPVRALPVRSKASPVRVSWHCDHCGLRFDKQADRLDHMAILHGAHERVAA